MNDVLTRGQKISLAKRGVVTRIGFRLSDEHKRKIGVANRGKSYPTLSIQRMGAGNPQWKGGHPKCIRCTKQLSGWKNKIHRSCRAGQFHSRWLNLSPEDEGIRDTNDYRKWKRDVLFRDDHRCYDCGKRGGKLNVHHIYPFALFPRLRLTLENGLTLCEDCHRRTDTYGGKPTPSRFKLRTALQIP